MSGRYGRLSSMQRALVKQALGEMAERLETARPDQPITEIGRIALIQATTMDPTLSGALRERVPEITGSVIRREFAQQLREIAGDA
ncbi:hypothetical protein [Streptomyces sp. NPDC051636]|uniref:hypothetical protein n=1 Tax=Streptomyces sp. NPDC051636 TaxID=3365663 RepID=UPI00379BFAC0